MTNAVDGQAALAAIKEAVGDNGWLADAANMAPYVNEWLKILEGTCQMVVRPGTTEQVAQVVRICHDAGIPITPQGGNTGMVGGAVPNGGIVLSTQRLNSIRELDADNATLTVEAGCLLADVQAAAADAGFLFPLTLASEGSCRIGGNIATNAGGNNTVRYGNTREQVLGLEVVLPDGRVWDGLRGLRKDNTGYDLKQLFIGAEGTLGVITAAVLSLVPAPRDRITAMAATESWDDLLKLFRIMRRRLSGSLVAFEVFTDLGIKITVDHIDDVNDPFTDGHRLYALMEATCYDNEAAVREAMETGLGEAFEEGIVTDAVLAESGQQAANLWNVREGLPEAQSMEAMVIKHDVSVPISRIPEYVAKGGALVEETIPGARLLPFGHMGDGNLHFNMLQPDDMERDVFLAFKSDINRKLHDLAIAMGGTFSAEHGIGLNKVGDLAHYRSEVELDLMARIKQAFDPANIMNPGKVIDIGSRVSAF
ncbi:MAG: FAD-binding oxidoreductase [Alphaproteobacteria bacterium]|nr:FAD-binding oxidoreductase [Alphaproteobacteria bacterium]